MTAAQRIAALEQAAALDTLLTLGLWLGALCAVVCAAALFGVLDEFVPKNRF